jgi:NAD-dependent dihydropyrimidine dehydrogenase PreA subunit
MVKKTIIHVDQDKCTGCGNCITACPESVLELIDGKARVVRESQCDGLGICIGQCPHDALSFEESDTTAPLAAPPAAGQAHAGCPGHANQCFGKPTAPTDTTTAASPSALGAWPIQLHLIRPDAPQFIGADVVIAASCSAFSTGSFHTDILPGKGLIIACPKLDNQTGYLEKLTDLFSIAKPKSVTVVRMTVPCCGGLSALVGTARDQAHSDLGITEVTIALDGDGTEIKTI